MLRWGGPDEALGEQGPHLSIHFPLCPSILHGLAQSRHLTDICWLAKRCDLSRVAQLGRNRVKLRGSWLWQFRSDLITATESSFSLIEETYAQYMSFGHRALLEMSIGLVVDWFSFIKDVISLVSQSLDVCEMAEAKVKVTQSCPTLCDSKNCSPQAHGVLHSRILEWVTIPFYRGSSWPRNQTWASCIVGGFFTIWATRLTGLAE